MELYLLFLASRSRYHHKTHNICPLCETAQRARAIEVPRYGSCKYCWWSVLETFSDGGRCPYVSSFDCTVMALFLMDSAISIELLIDLLVQEESFTVWA